MRLETNETDKQFANKRKEKKKNDQRLIFNIVDFHPCTMRQNFGVCEYNSHCVRLSIACFFFFVFCRKSYRVPVHYMELQYLPLHRKIE